MSTKHDLFVQEKSRTATETRRIAAEFNHFHRNARYPKSQVTRELFVDVVRLIRAQIELMDTYECDASIKVSYKTTKDYFISVVCALDLCRNENCVSWIILENTYNNSGWKGKRFLVVRVDLDSDVRHMRDLATTAWPNLTEDLVRWDGRKMTTFTQGPLTLPGDGWRLQDRCDWSREVKFGCGIGVTEVHPMQGGLPCACCLKACGLGEPGVEPTTPYAALWKGSQHPAVEVGSNSDDACRAV